jgi:hypothetical protein
MAPSNKEQPRPPSDAWHLAANTSRISYLKKKGNWSLVRIQREIEINHVGGRSRFVILGPKIPNPLSFFHQGSYFR